MRFLALSDAMRRRRRIAPFAILIRHSESTSDLSATRVDFAANNCVPGFMGGCFLCDKVGCGSERSDAADMTWRMGICSVRWAISERCAAASCCLPDDDAHSASSTALNSQWVTSLFDLTFAEPIHWAKVLSKYLQWSEVISLSESLTCKSMV